ncbi:hypothetical protein TNCT_495261 [Trichonephila clavata]|uniref:Uncharacterized protein n=1 Tax=Trichonephila clavata TaxID=2740835 RepID=A0A8X6I2E9_TRICU|nr:hypothetical protein TNCT_495261 [Trichonephila clavata]
MIYASSSKERRLLHDLKFLWKRKSRKTPQMIVTFFPVISIGITAKIQMLISYPDNIPSVIHPIPHGPNMPVLLPPTLLPVICSESSNSNYSQVDTEYKPSEVYSP